MFLGIFFVGTIVLLVLLARDVFTLTYLTPFAHFLRTIFTPFVPLLAPLTFGTFLKVCQHEKFPGQKLWIFITASWAFQHVKRAWRNVMSLYLGRAEDGGVMLCGLDECYAAWIEEVLLLVVIVGQIRGWKWDAGYVDMWIDGLAKQGLKRREAKTKNEEERRIEERALNAEEAIVDDESDQNQKVALLVDIDDMKNGDGN
jgi:hypothetical protein